MKNFNYLADLATDNDFKYIFKKVHGVDDTDHMNEYNLAKVIELFCAQASRRDIKKLSTSFQCAYNAM